ncbi:hypothetical protein Indivirus_1_40 [Indivirus ILV1]|uniref:Uncharacterized protein n=1 Tax=Indivirus ILV1 TaxID=1977633 RepID=A0A1V0SCH5_9VIRU|nr:hypothetical protein Indivirus_1_40 [Indivirus ILV1]
MMQQHYENFLTTLYKFVQDLDRYHQTDGTKQALEIYNKLDMAKVIYRIYTLLKDNTKISTKDESLFEKSFEILPNVDVAVCWVDLASNRKQKVWTYLSILQIESDILVNQPKQLPEQLPKQEPHQEPQQEPLAFDPYVGVGGNTSAQGYNVEQMYASLANMPDEESGSGPGLTSIAKLIGLDKMVNFEDLSEQLKNMKPEDIENATNNIKEMLGNNMDEKTTSMLNSMLSDISLEMKSANLGGGDPFKNIMSVAETVAGKMKPKIQNGELDINKLVNSTQAFASQCKDKDGNQIFAEGSNPFAMLNQLAASMAGRGGQPMNEQQMMSQANNMLKSMGLQGDVEQLLNNQQPKKKSGNKKKGKKNVIVKK